MFFQNARLRVSLETGKKVLHITAIMCSTKYFGFLSHSLVDRGQGSRSLLAHAYAFLQNNELEKQKCTQKGALMKESLQH